MKGFVGIIFFITSFVTLLGQEPIVPSKLKFTKEVGHTLTISNYAYTTCIDTVLNLPLWVSHAITNEQIKKGEVSRDRPNGYPQDPKYKTIKRNAYNSSGYDHGHIAPARDFKWDSTAWAESFYMTNMAPQHGCFNQKGWCHLESHCRKWAENDSLNVIYIVSGIIPEEFIDTLCHSNGLSIAVPARFFKAVLSYNSKTKEGKSIGFIMPNTDVNNYELENYIVTIDSIEEATGIDFFSSLRNRIEKNIEAKIGNFEFYETLDCPQKDCGKVYSGNRVLPEERAKLRCK